MTRPRYLLLVDLSDRGRCKWSGPSDLSAALRTRNALLLVDDRTPVQVAGELVLVGLVHDDARSRELLRRFRCRSAGSDGGLAAGDLPGACSGAYVAFHPNMSGFGVEVLRDASGGMPCYYAVGGGTLACASQVDDLVRLGVADGSVDFGVLAAQLTHDHLRLERTCLSGISELVPGHRLNAVNGACTVEAAWSPFDWAGSERAIGSFEEAARQVRSAVLEAVGAWAAAYERPLLSLSGGLDSSIVAAALDCAGRDFECVTLVTRDAGGDERRFAAAMAARVRRVLHVRELRVQDVDLGRSAAAHLPRPSARAFAQAADSALASLSGELGTDAFFSGGGGDNVFCLLASALPVADRFLAGGPLAALLTARDIGISAGVSTMAVARAAFRAGRRRGHRWPMNSALLSPALATDGEPPSDHPWLAAPPGLLPGKARHVAWLLGIQNHLEGFDRERLAPIVSPLLSRHVVEMCLRVPTWLWCRGGADRAVARAAFASELPRDVLMRRGKGSPGSFVIELLESRRRWALDFLGEGLLAEQRVIDLPAVAALLKSEAPFRSDTYSRLASLVDVEAWLRARQSRWSLAGQPLAVF